MTLVLDLKLERHSLNSLAECIVESSNGRGVLVRLGREVVGMVLVGEVLTFA